MLLSLAKTLRISCHEVRAQSLVDLIILVDDARHDATVAVCTMKSKNLRAYLFALVMVLFKPACKE